MARKPVKKRNARKVVKTPLKKRLKEPKFSLEIGSDTDPFFIDPATIPDGVALQWFVTHVMGDLQCDLPYAYDSFLRMALESGWNLVKGIEPLKGQVLVWAPKELADAQRDANIKRAQDQMAEIRQLFGMDGDYRIEGRRFPLVSESFMVSSNYERTPSDTPPLDVEVKLNLRLSAHFQDAAACLKLAPAVYAQRRLDLYLRGSLGGILLPVSASSVELFENGDFQLTTRIS